MAEMGLGYGSEFQLLRFLGHHRDELNNLIHESTGMSGAIHWKDFGYDDNKMCGDRELKGIECFKTLENYFQINEDWECFWPQSGSSMNWDAIFTIGDTWFFVEAKAHIGEAFQKCSATSNRSIETIEKAFDETKNWLGISKNDIRWIKTDCYQLANRLAFMRFCTKNGIKAKLLYISFVNGYYRKSVTSRESWETNVWDKQYEALGITQDSVKDLIYHIYPNCEPDNK